jgi:hypothetical protein
MSLCLELCHGTRISRTALLGDFQSAGQRRNPRVPRQELLPYLFRAPLVHGHDDEMVSIIQRKTTMIRRDRIPGRIVRVVGNRSVLDRERFGQLQPIGEFLRLLEQTLQPLESPRDILCHPCFVPEEMPRGKCWMCI